MRTSEQNRSRQKGFTITIFSKQLLLSFKVLFTVDNNESYQLSPHYRPGMVLTKLTTNHAIRRHH